MRAIPQADLDLFSEASLRDPFGDYRRLRDLGPVVRLRRPDVYAIGRFADVQTALRSSEALISGEGVGFSDAFNAPKGMNVIQSDGELHRRLRGTIVKPLFPAALRDARADLKAMIVARVGSLVGAGWFDAMKGLASFLPVEAISHLVGLPEVGRERMLEWAAAAFNVIGPRQAETDLAALKDAFAFMRGLNEETVRDGSWAGQLFAAARTGRLSMQEAMAAMSAYVIPSLDTTILAKGHLLRNLATHPEQWALLREQPDRITAAVLEGVRHSSVLRWFSRVAVADYAVEDCIVPAGQRVMLLYGCANRDERHYPDPDRFDINRDARDHLAWGTGAHMCAGMHLARLEMEVLLEALVEARVQLTAGEPVVGANSGLYGFTGLPLRIDAA
ncbi:MAG TPA: cytochrome P450 [Povalibacter sp.]|uniref:cytochrome P450 n=1 Tax=Povalibacter sp. TaxID=1962978 RepID=UPI002CCFC98F|nr:cytochrome P450 [Povalibacter sp.]HMN43027.1 cytochrome P450 [Povalibacter sp.]